MWVGVDKDLLTGDRRVHCVSIRLSKKISQMAGNVKRFYDLTAKLLSGEPLSFSTLKGKVVLIENVASL